MRIARSGCGGAAADFRFREDAVEVGRVRVTACDCGERACDGNCGARPFCKVRYCSRRCSMRCGSHCTAHCTAECRERVTFYDSGADDCGLYRPVRERTCGECHADADNCDCDESSSRDDRAITGMCARGNGISRRAPTSSGGAYAWGGAISRVTEVMFAPSREDDVEDDRHGAHLPFGFAGYKSLAPPVDNYVFRRAGQWRIAVPGSMGPGTVNLLVAKVMAQGPQAAGYVRIGDTLVPDSLGPGARAALLGASK